MAAAATADCQAWGEGGNGGTSTHGSRSGGGGGGGEYAEEAALAVSGTISFTIGSGGTSTSTSFPGTSVTVTAHFGGNAPGQSPGSGGTGSTNSTHHDGGNGGTGLANSNTGGAGGGGSAGASSGGGAGGAGTSGGAAGGTAGTGGGATGGAGGANSATGNNGNAPGSGAGGGGSSGSLNHTGGTGAAGQITLTYTSSQAGTATLSGTGTLTAAGSLAGAATLAGVGSLTAARSGSGNATLAGTGSLTAAATQRATATLAGAGTLTASGGTPAPAVVNAWSNSYGQGTTFGSITSALQSCVVPLTAAFSIGAGSGTATAGNWLFCIASWTQDPAIAQVYIGTGDDVHSWWREYPASNPAGNTRTAIYYTPNIARSVGNVYVAPDAEIAAINVIVIEVSGLGPWDTVAGKTSSYAAAATSLALALAAPGQASFFVGAVGGDDVSSGQTFAPGGWTTLPTQTQTNGSDHLADNILTAAYRPSSTLAQSVSASASAQDMSGFILGVYTAATSPIPAGQNPNWPYTIVEAGFGSGFNTPDSEITWTDITSRVWSLNETTGVQFQLGQIQASSMQLEFDNWDGNLSADNPGSPYYSDALNSNMSFQSGTSPWTGNNGATLAQSASFAYASSVNAKATYSLKVTPDGSTALPGAISEKEAVSASTAYTASAWFYSPAGYATGAEVALAWYTSGNAFISASTATAVAVTAGTWTQVTLTATSPVNAAKASVIAQFAGTPSATAFYVAEAAFVQGSSAVSTGLITSGVPIRLRMALGTIGGVTSNRWYILQRYAQEWGEQITDDYRRYCPVTATDVWASLSVTPPTFYRSEVYEDSPYAWWPLDDLTGPSGVLPTVMLNAAIGNTKTMNIALSPSGGAAQTVYSTTGQPSNGINPTEPGPNPSVASYTVGASPGWMFGDPQGEPASLATGNPISPSPGSAAWQQTGAAGTAGSSGWYMSCNDTAFPALSAGITIEAWFNYPFFGSSAEGWFAGSSVGVATQQPYGPLTIWEIATDTHPVAVLQLSVTGTLSLITYAAGTSTGTSHAIYSAADLRTANWHMATVTLTTTGWTVRVDGGALATVSGSATAMTSAWTWMILNADFGTAGGTTPASVQHGGNVSLAHIAVYPLILPYYRIMDHYWAAVTAFGQLPAPTSVASQMTGASSASATGPQTAAPDGSIDAGTYDGSSFTGNGTQPISAIVTANVAGYTSGPSARGVTVGSAYGIFGWVGWTGLAAEFTVYDAASAGPEQLASVSIGAGDSYTSGFGAGASGHGACHVSGGTGASPPSAGSTLGDTVGERIERLMRAGRCVSPNRCIDPAPLLVQAPGTAGGQQLTGDAIEQIAQSDGGLLYVDNCGHITYWQRPHLAAQYATPAWQLGPAGTPYELDVNWVTDPHRVWNAILITPFSPTGAQLPLITPTSAAAVNASQVRYGAQPLAITSWLQDTTEMQAQADWLFQWFGQPQRRVERAVIDAASQPYAWQLVAGVNVGDVVTVEDWQPGGGGNVITFRVTEINRKISYAAKGGETTARVELIADFEATSYWSLCATMSDSGTGGEAVRIFDCVLLGGETDLDLLETRMAELEDIPGVIHVICEAPADHKGEPKPKHFRRERHSDRFARWHGRWNHVEVEPDELPAHANADPKARKDALREYLWHGVTAEPGDLVMHGGIDEIPAPWVVRDLLSGAITPPVCLEMRWTACSPDLIHPYPWRGTAVREWSQTASFAGMRETRHTLPAVLAAGTRLSMSGHDPGDPPRHPDGHALWRVTPDETWPRLTREAVRPA